MDRRTFVFCSPAPSKKLDFLIYFRYNIENVGAETLNPLQVVGTETVNPFPLQNKL